MIFNTYTDAQGLIHWPDTLVGSKLDYGIDWSVWLTNESDTFVSMTWGGLPTGLTSSFNTDSGDISIINIEADAAGEYCINGIMASIENGHSQELPVKIYLKVEALC